MNRRTDSIYKITKFDLIIDGIHSLTIIRTFLHTLTSISSYGKEQNIYELCHYYLEWLNRIFRLAIQD